MYGNGNNRHKKAKKSGLEGKIYSEVITKFVVAPKNGKIIAGMHFNRANTNVLVVINQSETMTIHIKSIPMIRKYKRLVLMDVRVPRPPIKKDTATKYPSLVTFQ